MVDRFYFAQELLKLFTMKNKMIEAFVGDLVALIKEEDLNSFMLDVCSDEENISQYGMNFKIVAHYALPYIQRRYSKSVTSAWILVDTQRAQCAINNTPKMEDGFKTIEDNTNYDVIYEGKLIASSDEIKGSLYNGTLFHTTISKRVIERELEDSIIVAFLN